MRKLHSEIPSLVYREFMREFYVMKVWIRDSVNNNAPSFILGTSVKQKELASRENALAKNVVKKSSDEFLPIVDGNDNRN